MWSRRARQLSKVGVVAKCGEGTTIWRLVLRSPGIVRQVSIQWCRKRLHRALLSSVDRLGGHKWRPASPHSPSPGFAIVAFRQSLLLGRHTDAWEPGYSALGLHDSRDRERLDPGRWGCFARTRRPKWRAPRDVEGGGVGRDHDPTLGLPRSGGGGGPPKRAARDVAIATPPPGCATISASRNMP